MSKTLVAAILAALTSAIAGTSHAAQSSEQRSLNELRNTVVNLLQGLVERGVLTREQAERMVADAQSKAEVDALAVAEQEKAEEGAVRVPYVPEIVKDEIRKQVAADLTNEVTKQVVEQAQNESWGVPAALPEWTKRIRLSGDLRMRGQADIFASDNFVAFDPTTGAGNYDFLTINDRGGFSRAGQSAFFNATEDRERLRTRLRLGIDAELGSGFSTGLRLATGNFRDPVSTNQTLGNTGARYQIGVDQAYVKWYGQSRSSRSAEFRARG
jgi:polyhydroxyalkanoate synthesis regulator phasin